MSSFFLFLPQSLYIYLSLSFVTLAHTRTLRKICIKLCSRGCSRSILFRTMWQIQCACHGIAWPITRRFVWFVRPAIFIEDCSDDSNTTSKYFGIISKIKPKHTHTHTNNESDQIFIYTFYYTNFCFFFTLFLLVFFLLHCLCLT